MLSQSAYADVINPNEHPVQRCVVISNLAAFPDIVVVAGIRQTTKAGTILSYVVKADSCLDKGYKFNSLYLFWAAKSYFDSIGIANLDLKSLLPQVSAKKKAGPGTASPLGLLSGFVEPYGGTVHDSVPTVKEKFVYNLQADTEQGGVTLFLAEKTTIDKDSTKHTELFYPVKSAEPPPAQHAPAARMQAHLAGNLLQFTVAFSGDMAGELIDCRGRVIQHFTRDVTAGNSYLVSCPGVSAGIYWLRVNAANKMMTQKLHVFD
jgi:hypothetical protein